MINQLPCQHDNIWYLYQTYKLFIFLLNGYYFPSPVNLYPLVNPTCGVNLLRHSYRDTQSTVRYWYIWFTNNYLPWDEWCLREKLNIEYYIFGCINQYWIGCEDTLESILKSNVYVEKDSVVSCSLVYITATIDLGRSGFPIGGYVTGISRLHGMCACPARDASIYSDIWFNALSSWRWWIITPSAVTSISMFNYFLQYHWIREIIFCLDILNTLV